MIRNQTKYEITAAAVLKFENSSFFMRAELAAIDGQLETLKQELAEYERTHPQETHE